MYIEPLSYETLDEAINLVNKVFPYQSLSENASLAFQLSLEQNIIIAKKCLFVIGITEARYWIAVDEQSRKVIGTT